MAAQVARKAATAVSFNYSVLPAARAVLDAAPAKALPSQNEGSRQHASPAHQLAQLPRWAVDKVRREGPPCPMTGGVGVGGGWVTAKPCAHGPACAPRLSGGAARAS